MVTIDDDVSERKNKRRERHIRWAVLGTLYAVAIAFAVLFSPFAGVVPQAPSAAPPGVAENPVPTVKR